MTKMHIRIFFSTIFIALVLSCTSTDKISRGDDFSLVPESVLWEKIDGAQYCFVQASGVRYHAVKIDLAQNGIDILAYPFASDETNGLRSKKFASLTGAQIAINTAPFTREGEIMGIHLVDGKTISRPLKRLSAISFEREGDGGFSAHVVENQTEESFDGAEFAFGGFFTILKDGQIREFSHTSYDARSVAGISEDGRTLFLLVVEKNWRSNGLSYPECAEILQRLGADDAIEFDGGRSTSFLVAQKNVRHEESFRLNKSYLGFSFH